MTVADPPIRLHNHGIDRIELLSWWFMFLGSFFYHDESLWNQKWKFLCRRAKGFTRKDARRAARIGWPKIPKRIFDAAMKGDETPPARTEHAETRDA